MYITQLDFDELIILMEYVRLKKFVIRDIFSLTCALFEIAKSKYDFFFLNMFKSFWVYALYACYEFAKVFL